MKINELYIFPEDKNAHLITYIQDNPPEMDNPPRRAMLICPGGGYEWVSNRESEPIALQFLARGYNVFVLKYSTGKQASNLIPLREIEAAIKHIRDNAIPYNISIERVFVLGFSAGGPLALSSGTLLPKESRPNAMVLCYPVVTATCPTHMGSLYNFCGTNEPTDEQKHLFSLDLHVDYDTPPTFVWHTENDDAVPVQNSKNLALALTKHNIKHELVLFPDGHHGLALATSETCKEIPENEPHPCSAWVDLADKWLKEL
jgi:acetyl esterase/lipase